MRQIKLDRQPMNLRKFSLKALKHGLWLAIAALTGFTFVAYFSPAAALGHDMLAFTAGPWETFWVAFYGFATYGNAGWMREQVCKYMCPYARFQSAMFDNDTLTVTYDEKRGEPRGSRAGGSEYREAGLGDCINCTMCVQVCPTGIDIRDGLQYECIGCSACIDVCNDVMAKMNYPKGLIRYTTHNAVEGKPSRLIRPRILVYGAILVGLIAVFIFLLLQRSTLQLDVIRDRNQLYREVHGTIENVYTLKVINMDDESHRYSLAIDELPSAELIIETPRIDVNAGAVLDVPVRVRVNEDDLKNRSTKIAFVMVAVDDETIRISESARFLGPIP